MSIIMIIIIAIDVHTFVDLWKLCPPRTPNGVG